MFLLNVNQVVIKTTDERIKIKSRIMKIKEKLKRDKALLIEVVEIGRKEIKEKRVRVGL